MGLIEAMAFASVFPTGVIPFGAPIGLWALLVGTLGAAAFGIWLAVPRPVRRAAERPQLVRGRLAAGAAV